MLHVTITSFSFRNLPDWRSDPNGGGFQFDCRCLPNPGRSPEFKTLTGLDISVKEYLLALPEVENFVRLTTQLVSQSIEAYQLRHFTALQVAYGCTGGQHRSVYCAERAAELISSPTIQVTVHHHQRLLWPRKESN